jgi:hypothetical protein
MRKFIRRPEQLRAHLDAIREEGETDRKLALRLGMHWNTITKLKHYGAAFETPVMLAKLGIKVLYEVIK